MSILMMKRQANSDWNEEKKILKQVLNTKNETFQSLPLNTVPYQDINLRYSLINMEHNVQILENSQLKEKSCRLRTQSSFADIAKFKHQENRKRLSKQRGKKMDNLENRNLVNYECSICKIKFLPYETMEKSETECVFVCAICKKIFPDKHKTTEHLIQHENEKTVCLRCDKVMPQIQPRETKTMYTCDICKKRFIHMKTLRRHIRAHMENLSSDSQNFDKQRDCTKKSTTCHICNKTFVTLTRMNVHISRQHGIVFKPESLLVSHNIKENCTEFSVHKSHLDTKEDSEGKESSQSENKEDSPEKLDYECNKCEEKFLNLIKLQAHIMKTHEQVKYQCEKCDRTFLCQKDLEAHVEKENCLEEVTCTCQVCGKGFAKLECLKKHQHEHTDVTFKCKFCYCPFMREKSYIRHIQKMNCSKNARKSKLMEFNFRKCRICQVEYENESFLLAHFKEHHKNEEPHQCFCCDSRLPTFRDLQMHIHDHDVKKYTCHLCGKPYTSQEGFRKHRLKHKGAEFKCKFCESEFLNESRFKFHEKTCRKNPEMGYDPILDKPKKKDETPKHSRQLHWESRIIMKRLRGDPKSGEADIQTSTRPNESSLALAFFDESDSEPNNERGWFDNYYKTEEDEIAFGLRKADGTPPEPQSNDDMMQNNKKSPAEPIQSSSGTSESSSSEEDESLVDELPIEYNPKKCRLCLVTYDQEYELLHHFIKVHPTEMAHKCPICNSQSPLFAQLKEHMKIHGIGMNIFYCDNCSKKFKSEKKMRSHNLKCKASAIGEEKTHSERCKRCGKKFNTKFGYRRHRRLCKVKKKLVRKTKRCLGVAQVADTGVAQAADKHSQESTNPSLIKSTEKGKAIEVVEPPMDSFPCRLCEKKFQYERGIVMHFKSSHPGHKPLVCHVCNMHLADKLKEHLKTHGIGEEFICELCGKRFNQKFLSKIHEMWHEGIEYKCNNCKQKFLNKEKMDKHVRENRCSNRQSLMRLPCLICGKSCRSKFGLNQHYITHTPKELRPVKNRMNCEYCGKWFQSNNGLQRHRRIHTGERPFCCRFCPKAFAQEGNCKVHEKIHTGEARRRNKKTQIPHVKQAIQMVAQPTVVPVRPPPTSPYPGHLTVYMYDGINSNAAVH
ncbi:hypothetical protein RUM44_007718 [Polyplax serrata]|uniref:C2H2-type domain-containing protein n=1 Tax=Polyplax serrata TaxID=468196 RepID=A0ABR1BB65_POLSC